MFLTTNKRLHPNYFTVAAASMQILNIVNPHLDQGMAQVARPDADLPRGTVNIANDRIPSVTLSL